MSLAKTLLGFEIKNLRRVTALRRILLSIGDYTLRTWGKAQAARYLGELEVGCHTLSDNSWLGRLCDEVHLGLRRLEHGMHVVFYRQERGGILVSRILYQRMLPDRHCTEDQDDEA